MSDDGRRTDGPGLADIASVDRAVRRESYEWGVAHGRNEIAELEAIVRDLASLDDPFVQGDIFEGSACRYCDAPLSTLHAEDCDWRRAREWVAAHPVSGDQP